tara:strand:+ start:27824 stop:28936 length:1113 start_codon:yes stop_codon:yes gene_type:complete
MDYSTDVVVIGAGVVGLAIARELAATGLETIVLESAAHIGEETSSRNSEVIHAGIYYPPGSVKANTCVRGKQLLYDYIESHGVPHRQCGKLVVASSEAERGSLQAIQDRAERCAVSDLRWLDAAAIAELEPQVSGSVGLFSPSTGIVDSHQLMLALQGDIESLCGSIALSSPVLSGTLDPRSKHVLRVGGDAETELGCRFLINASGLFARDVGLQLRGAQWSQPPAAYYAKGHYYSYPGKPPFSHLVYPLPEAGGLGVHATIDLAGQVRFGPDVRWVDEIDYAFDDSQREAFAAAVRRYYPGLDSTRLQPGYTGIRPKVSAPGAPASDFTILLQGHHGVPGFCSLHGIESPGLTACLAIAEYVSGELLAQ